MILPKAFRSLRARLVLASLTVEVLVAVLMIGNGLRLIDQHLVSQAERRKTAMELAYKTAVGAMLVGQDYATLREILDGWREAEDIEYLVVADPSGRRVASSGWGDGVALPSPSAGYRGHETYHATFAVDVLGQTYGSVHYGMSLDYLEAARRELLLQGVAIAAIGLLLSGFTLAAIGFWLTRHLSSLTAASSDIAAGRYQTALPAEGEDEIGLLTHNFRQMALAVEARIADLDRHLSRQRALFEALGEGVYGLDREGRCTFINPAALEMLGLDEADVLNRQTHALFHARRADGSVYLADECPVHLTAEDGRRRTVEDWFWRRDGSGFPVILTVTPLLQDGEFQGTVIAFRDISEIRQATEALRDSSERLKSFIDALPDIVVIKDGESRWQTVNRAAERILQLDGLPWQGKDNRQLAELRPGFAQFHLQAADSDEAAWRDGKLWLCIEDISAEGEAPRQCEVRKIPRFAADRSRKSIMVIARDISARLRDEAELARYRESLEQLVMERTTQLEDAKRAAEQANIAKSTFLANMSHEIRTPLNAITGMAHLIRRAGLEAEQADRLDKLEAAGAHLLEIINSVLDLSKIEAGKLTLDEGPVQVEEIFENIRSMLQAKADGKGVALCTDIAPLPENLIGDRVRLQQALLNYAVNAVKFTDAGRVTLRARIEQEEAASVLIRFEVADTGIGIPPEVLSRLFGAFEQADSSTTRKYGGTGLGLAITRSFARKMDGDAGAFSSPGQGSTFWFTARLAKGGAAGQDAGESAEGGEAELRRDFAGCRILLAEDEPVNCEITACLLDAAGLQVDTAEDGLVAVDLAGQRHYDLILMDMQMPNLDGLGATQAIRRMPAENRVPIIAMTANAFVEDKTRCLEAGMDDFIAKPVDPDKFYQVLGKWLAVRREAVTGGANRTTGEANDEDR